MTEPCYRCGGECVDCSCAPCPKCDGMICQTCDGKNIVADPFGITGLRVDTPLPPRTRPSGLPSREPTPIEIVPEQTASGHFYRYLNSQELLPAPPEQIVRGICAVFGTVAAGLVAGVVAVGFAAVGIFSGGAPE